MCAPPLSVRRLEDTRLNLTSSLYYMTDIDPPIYYSTTDSTVESCMCGHVTYHVILQCHVVLSCQSFQSFHDSFSFEDQFQHNRQDTYCIFVMLGELGITISHNRIKNSCAVSNKVYKTHRSISIWQARSQGVRQKNAFSNQPNKSQNQF